jgi:hypothetical protein
MKNQICEYVPSSNFPIHRTVSQLRWLPSGKQ